MLNTIPLFGYITFFIHSSVDGNLNCFHLIAIVNSAARNIPVQLCFPFFLGSIGVELLGQMITLCLIV